MKQDPSFSKTILTLFSLKYKLEFAIMLIDNLTTRKPDFKRLIELKKHKINILKYIEYVLDNQEEFMLESHEIELFRNALNQIKLGELDANTELYNELRVTVHNIIIKVDKYLRNTDESIFEKIPYIV